MSLRGRLRPVWTNSLKGENYGSHVDEGSLSNHSLLIYT